MSSSINSDALREQVREKYKEVAINPSQEFHFHTGRYLAEKLGYSPDLYDHFPESAVESFAGVNNPFSIRELSPGEKVVDIGCGAGFDCYIAASLVGDSGQVIGVDMTNEMLEKANHNLKTMEFDNVRFKKGFLEDIPVETSWADSVISNGVINLCVDKMQIFKEILRVLKPGGFLQFSDIANSIEVPQAAIDNIDLWTA
tara:strand:- start:581 stop:1180 length:600 start_codon:yes stop_codon:yes gene_type:complete